MMWFAMALLMMQPGAAPSEGWGRAEVVTEAREAPPEAYAAFFTAADAWHDCTTKEVVRLANRSREPAETVATAAMGTCGVLEGDAADELRLLIVDELGTEEGADAAVTRATEKGRAKWREKLVAVIVALRSQ